MRQSAVRIVAFTLGVALIGATVSPQDQALPSRDPLEMFAEAVEVEVINIDVYVTDKKGRPIHGLTSDDFLLFVDGRAVPISNFYAVAEPSDIAAESEEVPGAQTPPEVRTVPVEPVEMPAVTPLEQRLHVVVYIDNFNLTPFNRNRVLRQLRTFLREQLGPEDQVMVASYDRSLHLRFPFTGKAHEVSQALLELEEVSAQRVHRDRERADIISMVLDVDFDREDVAYNQLYAYAQSVRNDTAFTIEALNQMVDNLAGSPGRKALVYVADGIPMTAGEDLFYFMHQQPQWEGLVSLIEMTEFNFARRFEELAAKANTNRVTFYTIDARGVTVMSQSTVEQASAGEPGRRAFIDSIWLTNLQHPLQMMAEETGGRAIINANKILPDLDKIGMDFRNYYSLGYSPLVRDEGRYHRIEVKLKDKSKGWKIRHRTGFRGKTIETKMIDNTYSALNLDLQQNGIGANLYFGQPEPREDGHFNTPVFVEVPFENLTLIESDDQYLGRLRLWMAAKDARDRSTEVQEVPVDIRIPRDRIGETEGKNYTYGLKLTMQSGEHHLAVGVRDDLSGQFAVLRKGIRIQDS